MRIRTRIAFLFSVITASILLVFATTIYLIAAHNREVTFYQLLEKEAWTKANIFLNTQVSASHLQAIYKNNKALLNEVEVAIYNPAFTLLYHDDYAIDRVQETPEMLRQIRESQQLLFYEGDYQVVGISHTFQGKEYLITAAAYDEFGYLKLKALFQALLTGIILSLLVIFLAGQYFSTKVFAPISAFSNRAQSISASNLNLRLPVEDVSEKKDELTVMALTFNAMLDRLASSFEAQKNVVSTISHELRTPLAALSVELEMAQQQARDASKDQQIIENALSDTTKLKRLINSLLDLAQLNYDRSTFQFEEVRVDEVLIDAQQQLAQHFPAYRIQLAFAAAYDASEDTPASGDEAIETIVIGNAHLLEIAFLNLMENACKFSPGNPCKVWIAATESEIKIRFEDQGIGIPEAELSRIFDPFFRGENAFKAEGNGIGLHLTQKIVILHQGSLKVKSIQGAGTTVHIHIPRILPHIMPQPIF